LLFSQFVGWKGNPLIEALSSKFTWNKVTKIKIFLKPKFIKEVLNQPSNSSQTETAESLKKWFREWMQEGRSFNKTFTPYKKHRFNKVIVVR